MFGMHTDPLSSFGIAHLRRLSMKTPSSSAAVCHVALATFVVLAATPTTRGHVEDTNADQANVDRSGAAPIRLAGPCYIVNGRWVCY
jgi:hypothetical protein